MELSCQFKRMSAKPIVEWAPHSATIVKRTRSHTDKQKVSIRREEFSLIQARSIGRSCPPFDLNLKVILHSEPASSGSQSSRRGYVRRTRGEVAPCCCAQVSRFHLLD